MSIQWSIQLLKAELLSYFRKGIFGKLALVAQFPSQLALKYKRHCLKWVNLEALHQNFLIRPSSVNVSNVNTYKALRVYISPGA